MSTTGTRRTNTGNDHGYIWTKEAEDAVIALGKKAVDSVVVLSIDAKEELVVHASQDITVDRLSTVLPTNEGCYVVFSWAHPDREIIYITSCPDASPIKQRMVFSSGAYGTSLAVKNVLEWNGAEHPISSKRVETTEPAEVNEEWLTNELKGKVWNRELEGTASV